MDFSIGSLSAPPGEKRSGFYPVAQRPDGSSIGIPLIIVHGREPGPVFCVDGGTHGDEHEGALAILQIVRKLDPSRLRGTFIGVTELNGPAADALQRGNPFDHWATDLNRLFPGNENGNLTQRIARAYLDHIARDANYVISLHSGASYLYWSPMAMCGNDAPSVELCKALGEPWDILGQSEGVSGSARDAFEARGVAAASIEVGGAAERVFGAFQKNIDLAAEAVLNAMRQYGMIDGQPTRASSWTYVINRAVRSGCGGLAVPVGDFPLRRSVSAGTPLVHLYSLLGEELELVRAPFEGIVTGFRSFPYAPAGWPLVWLSKIVKTEKE